MQVRKIELSLQELIELALPRLADKLPDDALPVVAYTTNSGYTVGVLVESSEYKPIEAGDLVLYAPLLKLKSKATPPEPIATKSGTGEKK